MPDVAREQHTRTGATEQQGADTTQAKWLRWALALLMFGTISGRTLWIDEFSTAMIAREPSPLSALQYALSNLGSEALMPGWVVLTNLAGSLFGTSELGLRTPNAVWLTIAVFLMAGIGTRRTNIGPAMAFAVLPFVWYYGHEARPYALQLLLGAYWAWAAWRLAASGWREGRWALLAATTALVWSGLTAAIVGLTMSLALVLLGWRHLGPGYRTLAIAATSVALIGPVMAYYAYAVLIDGASAARLWQIGIANLAFAAYEILGFVGLGPGRLDLRDAGLSGIPTVINLLRSYAWPLLVLGVAWVVMMGAIARRLTSAPELIAQPTQRFIVIGGVSVLAGVLALAAAALVADFPVWGRHFAPIVPTLAAMLGLVAQSIWSDPSRRSIRHVLVLTPLVISLAVSSMQLRLLERHQVEDYRSAVSVAEAALAEGLEVAWFATPQAITYYLPSEEFGGRIFRPTAALEAVGQPLLIVLSKPDIHDPRNLVGASIEDPGSDSGCVFEARGFYFSVLGARDSSLCRRLQYDDL